MIGGWASFSLNQFTDVFLPQSEQTGCRDGWLWLQHWLNAGECIGVKTALRTEEFLFIRRNEKFVVLAEWAAFDGFFYSWVIHLLILSSKKSVYVASC